MKDSQKKLLIALGVIIPVIIAIIVVWFWPREDEDEDEKEEDKRVTIVQNESNKESNKKPKCWRIWAPQLSPLLLWIPLIQCGTPI